MPRLLPAPIPAGPLSYQTAQALTEALRDLYALLGGLSTAPPLTGRMDTNGLSLGLNLTALATSIGAGLEVKEVDGAPDYLAVTVLSFDQADGFVLTQPGAGQARVDMAIASASQVGIIALADQYLGSGIKTVDQLRVATTSAMPFGAVVAYVNGSVAVTSGFGFYSGSSGAGTAIASFIAGGTVVSVGAQMTAHDLFLSLDANTRILNLNSTTDATQPVYACRGTSGVSVTAVLAKITVGGTNGSLVTVGGIVTAYTPPT